MSGAAPVRNLDTGEEFELKFSGKTVVVTGSGSGIGAQTVRRFAQAGAAVVVADIDLPAAEKVASSTPGALAVRVDVTSRDELHHMVATVTAEFGGIDVLINNAMTCSTAPFLEISPEEVQRDFAVNAVGPFFASQEVIPGMIERGGGVILNVASINGLAYFGNDAYSSAKAALMNLTKSVAAQFGADGIRCNAVAPGSIATERREARLERDPLAFEKLAKWYPLGRIGSPDDIADALMFLASPAASWITGVVLPVEGSILTGNVEMARTLMRAQNEDGNP